MHGGSLAFGRSALIDYKRVRKMVSVPFTPLEMPGRQKEQKNLLRLKMASLVLTRRTLALFLIRSMFPSHSNSVQRDNTKTLSAKAFGEASYSDRNNETFLYSPPALRDDTNSPSMEVRMSKSFSSFVRRYNSALCSLAEVLVH